MIFKNESTAAKRRQSFTFFDNFGQPLAGQTFTTAGGEVFVSTDGGAWTAAAGDAVAVGNGEYYYEFSQGETNHNALTLRIVKATYLDIFVPIDLFDPAQVLTANVTQWLGSAPAVLSTNGYVQTMLLRWLTDNGAGTPAQIGAVGGLPVIQAVGQGPGGTLKPNCVVDNYTYNTQKKPTAWRERVFANSTAAATAYSNVNATTGIGSADGADSEVEREKYTAEYDAAGQKLLALKRIKEL